MIIEITMEPLFGVRPFHVLTPNPEGFASADYACRCPFLHRKRQGYSCQFPGMECPALKHDTSKFVLTTQEATRDA